MYEDVADLWEQAPLDIPRPKIYYGLHQGENRLFLTLQDDKSVFLFTPIDPISGGKSREPSEPYKEHRVFSCVQSQCEIDTYLDQDIYILKQLKVISCTKPFNEAHEFVIKKILQK